MQHLVYLHGFLSSPKSEKAQQTLAFAKTHFPWLNVHLPELPGDIDVSISKIDSLVSTLPTGRFSFIGSSMGGFLSTYCVEKYGGKAVLINPAVEPFNLLSAYIGQHVNPYTDEKFVIHSGHLSKLKGASTEYLKSPKAYFTLLQKGDETLDYRLAAKKYAKAKLVIEDGGNHSFVDYHKHLPDIFKFLLS
ncbi:YqiA/YcfP family alpha/beta fold hydrolase [Glaciecola petra]|uniref:YqiA/YcfP family alpha/beta fold hydrolase n=1 Tax=Glaciecola petra TaxID=3075602 RepID=A0ABU2ZLZ5_9ALTE|nr:YqiA/YcfP family alpha/beta fold hydrolase [Aestuariibacter sp. P117]MDT0593364.1 YqiA/YcfP family alpha/beta fold hydrolase [Aestuariibacter sp. P117]